MSIGLWFVIALGPVLGGAALLRPATTAPGPDSEEPPAGVVGLAELSVTAHLGSAQSAVDDLLEPALGAFQVRQATDGLSTAELEADLLADQGGPDHVATLATTPAGPDRWGVTVGVLADGSLRSYQVTVAMSPAGPLLETRPALVASPAPDRVPSPGVTGLREPEDDAQSTAVAGFLSAYLTGEGDLTRYTATDAEINRPAVTVASTDLLRLATGPFGERQAVVLAEARTIGADGAVSVMQFPLLMGQSDGRWEVRRVLPALPLRPSSATPTDRN